jgi:hypothetical protein
VCLRRVGASSGSDPSGLIPIYELFNFTTSAQWAGIPSDLPLSGWYSITTLTSEE